MVKVNFLHFEIADRHVLRHFQHSFTILWLVEFLETNQFQQLLAVVVLRERLLYLWIILFDNSVFFIVWVIDNILHHLLNYRNWFFQRFFIVHFLVKLHNLKLKLFFETLWLWFLIRWRCVICICRLKAYSVRDWCRRRFERFLVRFHLS